MVGVTIGIGVGVGSACGEDVGYGVDVGWILLGLAGVVDDGCRECWRDDARLGLCDTDAVGWRVGDGETDTTSGGSESDWSRALCALF